MNTKKAEIICEYGPFDGIERINGVAFDGERVWLATGDRLHAIDPDDGTRVQAIDVASHAGTAFDGEHLFQISESRILKIDPKTGSVVKSIPAPADGGDSGLTWAEGTLWVGHYRARKIHQVDPETGKVLRSIEASRFVTGVTWSGPELWHGTWEDEWSDIRRIDPADGAVLEVIEMPADTVVSGLASDDADRLFCGGAASGKLRVVRRGR